MNQIVVGSISTSFDKNIGSITNEKAMYYIISSKVAFLH